MGALLPSLSPLPTYFLSVLEFHGLLSLVMAPSCLPLKSFLSTQASYLVTPFPFHLKTFTTFSHPNPFGGFVILAFMPVSNIYTPTTDSQEATMMSPGAFTGKICTLVLSAFPAWVLSAFDPAYHAGQLEVNLYNLCVKRTPSSFLSDSLLHLSPSPLFSLTGLWGVDSN